MITRSDVVQSFDLTAVEAARYRKQRSTERTIIGSLFLLLGIGVVGFYFGGSGLVHNWAQLVSSTEGLEAIALFLVFIVYEVVVAYGLWLSFQHGGRGPIRLEISPEGFSLVWRDGSARMWTWLTFRGKLVLHDLSGSGVEPTADVQLSPMSIAILTREACAAIQSRATERGLIVSDSSQSGGGDYVYRTITIRRTPKARSSA
jgi:hypothetical protein